MNPINYGLAIFWPDFLWEFFSRYNMAFIEPLYQNKPNITEFLRIFFFFFFFFWGGGIFWWWSSIHCWCHCTEDLTHWGRATHICVGNLTIIDSDNGLSPGRRQAIILTNDGILSIGPLGTNFNEISIGIQTFSFKKMHFKMSSAKWRPFCLSLNVLKKWAHELLTHLPLDEVAAISQTIFSDAFKISLKFVPEGPIENKPALV